MTLKPKTMKRILFALTLMMGMGSLSALASCMDFAGEQVSYTSVPEQTRVQQKFKKVETEPKYGTGDMELMQDLVATLKYPEECAKQNIGGRAVVTFTVTKKGKVTDVKVVRSTGNTLLDAEAMRAVQHLPKKWIPGTFKGKPVNVSYSLPVNFKLK